MFCSYQRACCDSVVNEDKGGENWVKCDVMSEIRKQHAPSQPGAPWLELRESKTEKNWAQRNKSCEEQRSLWQCGTGIPHSVETEIIVLQPEASSSGCSTIFFVSARWVGPGFLQLLHIQRDTGGGSSRQNKDSYVVPCNPSQHTESSMTYSDYHTLWYSFSNGKRWQHTFEYYQAACPFS